MAVTDRLCVESMMDVGRLGDVRAAWELSGARHITPELTRELPYVARGYRNVLSALRRQVYVRARASEANLVPYRLMYCGRYVGMATLQLLDPMTSMRDGTPVGFEFTDGAEIAYWHQPLDEAVGIGCEVVEALVEDSWRLRSSVVPWMVTLPEDDVKGEVCIRNGFDPLEPAIPYSINDGVTEPRQLWVHDRVE